MSMKKSAKTRLASVSVLMVVLASGVVLGMALDRHLEARNLSSQEVQRPAFPRGDEWGRRGARDRSGEASRTPSRGPSQRGPSLLVEQVGLSEQQVERVDSLMSYYRDQMRLLHEEFDEAYSVRYRDIQNASREAIRGVLTAEQLVVYDSIRAEWRRRWEEDRQSSEGGGGGSPDSGSRGRRFP